MQLLNPIEAPPIRYEERVFAAHDGQNLTLGVYRPAYVHDPVPAIIVIHGGSWSDGDRREFAAFNAYLASRDYVVAAIDYRLAPQWRFPAARDDVLNGVAFLKVYASELRIDPTRLALLGRSGGGQLALLAAYTAQEPAIKGVISLYGPSDLGRSTSTRRRRRCATRAARSKRIWAALRDRRATMPTTRRRR